MVLGFAIHLINLTMKKYLVFTYIILLFVCLCSCRKALKDVNDYIPKVTLVSAIIQDNGSVLLTGSIENKSDSPAEYKGFCYDTKNPNSILDNQVPVGAGGAFTAEIGGLNVDSVYYFKAWAANSYGYSYSNVISLDSVMAAPIVPPCSLTPNTVDFGDGIIKTYAFVSQPTTSYEQISYTATTTNGNSVNFTFGSSLTTRTYITSSDPSPESGEIFVSTVSGGLNPGTTVYLNALSPGVYELTICNAPKTYSGYTFIFNSRCTFSY